MSSTSARTAVRIGRSPTGLGLFATKPIAKKAYIATYRGKRIPTAEAHLRERAGKAKYMFELNARWTIDGASRRNLGRYINHACRPNCEAVLRKGQLIFVALRDIAPGEEITLDYGKDYFDLFIAPLGCRCATCAKKAARIYGKSPRRDAKVTPKQR
ncbi:MAG TPA: SET domain-containing protein [Xanthobacteraceae bacterium]|nr:SET domain-containing protein [Xanthobacteraceae bacterium]